MPEITSIRFCEGCNEKVDLPAGASACPVCGQVLGSDATTTLGLHPELPWRPVHDVDPATAADPLAGSDLDGYRLEELIGKGGMARVYRARHVMLERPCAIKVLAPELAAHSPDHVRLFFREARVAAALVHPNVVEIHNIGNTRGLHFIEMELVDGESLHTMLGTDGALDPVAAIRWMCDISSALAHAHRSGLLHRDIKPANVMINARGTAKLTDFGLAKPVVSAARRTGRLAGTPHYMAPELFSEVPASTASDVYACGVTGFQLLTGSLPFPGPTLGTIIERHRHEDVTARLDDVDLSPEAREVLGRCLAKDPAERYADGTEVHGAFRSLLGRCRDLASLIAEALEPLAATSARDGERFEITMRLAGGRRQQVIVETDQASSLTEQRIRIYSVCAPSREHYFQRALELNAAIPSASIAILDIGGEPFFIAVDSHLRGTCDPEELRASIETVARSADHIEELLTGRDRY